MSVSCSDPITSSSRSLSVVSLRAVLAVCLRDDSILIFDDRDSDLMSLFAAVTILRINLPNKETYLSETHAILVPNTKNEWILPSDNISLFQRKITKIIYYNFELPNYFTDNIVANNLPIESWSAGKFKYKYSGKIQKFINKKKVFIMNKYKV